MKINKLLYLTLCLFTVIFSPLSKAAATNNIYCPQTLSCSGTNVASCTIDGGWKVDTTDALPVNYIPAMYDLYGVTFYNQHAHCYYKARYNPHFQNNDFSFVGLIATSSLTPDIKAENSYWKPFLNNGYSCPVGNAFSNIIDQQLCPYSQVKN